MVVLRSILLLLFAFLVLSTHDTRAQSEQCLSQTLARADSIWQAALSTRSVDEVLKSYAPDAAMCGAAMPQIVGTANIRRFWEQQFADTSYRLMWSMEKARALGDCEHGYTSGRWQVHTSQGDMEGSYLAVWYRNADASWRLLLDCAWF